MDRNHLSPVVSERKTTGVTSARSTLPSTVNGTPWPPIVSVSDMDRLVGQQVGHQNILVL